MTHRYRAFLSYSHADEVTATRLHRALEHYTLPARVRKAHRLPRRLIPIFRDVEELAAASGLTTRLQDALDQSQWLIVLCSPAAAQSKYVNEEIEYFLQKHGRERILCALIAGEPAESFPPAIKSLPEEPLAADFRPGKDFELSKLKLIAALAGVGFTELRNREAQRRKRQQLIAASLVAGAGFGGLAYWDLFHREHVEHYANYVRRHGIWEGVDRVSSEMVSHRAESLRFTRHGRLNPPAEVRRVSGRGACKGEGFVSILGHTFGELMIDQRACSVTFDYGRDGAVRTETARSRHGAALESFTYTQPHVAQFTLDGYAAAGSRAGIYYIEFTRDESGFDRSIRFFHSRGVPRSNAERHFGYALEYDPQGRMTGRAVLDENGQSVGDDTASTFDDAGNRTGQTYLDGEGRPRQEKEGCFGETWTHDRWGNALTGVCLEADGSPGLNRFGISGVFSAYDDHGNVVREGFLDRKGQPTAVSWGVAETRYQYDERGFETRRAFFGPNGEPVLNDGHGWTSRHDVFGNTVEFAYFGTDGKPACVHSGVCIWRIEYDAHGRAIGQSYFDTAGRPMMIAHGAAMRVHYNEAGLPVEVTRLGPDGKPFLPPDLGYAKVRLKRDERGNRVERLFLDAQDQPVLQDDGAAMHQFDYDEFGNQVEARYFGAGLRLAKNKERYAVALSRYDRLGQAVEMAFLDEQRRPTLHRDGYFGYRIAYDARGREVERRYVDAKGQAIRAAALGFHGVRYLYGPYENPVEAHYLDAEGKTLRGTALARVVYRYDRGMETERRYLDGNGRPAQAPRTGCAIYRSDYDETLRTVAETCLDGDERLRNRLDSGWAVKKIAYESGRVVEEKYLDAAGREIKPLRP